MKVRLLLFGAAAETAGPVHEGFVLPGGAVVAGLRDAVSAAFPAASAALGSVAFAVAVNRKYARPDHALAEGDEVALIPPVSGG